MPFTVIESMKDERVACEFPVVLFIEILVFHFIALADPCNHFLLELLIKIGQST